MNEPKPLRFRTIRPDATMFTVCVAVLFACSILDAKMGLPLAMLFSAPLPLAGLPMLPYTAATLVITFYFGVISKWTAVSLLCLRPQELAEVSRQVGGSWRKIPLEGAPYAAALAQSRYAMDFYRRIALN